MKARNLIGAEYYNFKNELNDRKIKLLANPQYRDKLEIDQIMVKYTCIDRESQDEFAKQRYRFVIPEVDWDQSSKPRLRGS